MLSLGLLLDQYENVEVCRNVKITIRRKTDILSERVKFSNGDVFGNQKNLKSVFDSKL